MSDKNKYKYEDAYDFIFNNSNEDLIRYRHKYFLSLNKNFNNVFLDENDLNSLRKVVLQYSKQNETEDHREFYKFCDVMEKSVDPAGWDVDFRRFYEAYRQHKENLKNRCRVSMVEEDTWSVTPPELKVGDRIVVDAKNWPCVVTEVQGPAIGFTSFEDGKKDLKLVSKEPGRYTEDEIRSLWSIPSEYKAKKIKTNIYNQNTKHGILETFQTTLEFERPTNKVELAPIFTEEQLKTFFESQAQEAPNFSRHVQYKSDSGRKMVQIMIPDVHYGLQLYDNEGNEIYSPQIVENKLYSLLINELPNIITNEVETILFVLGNDWYHIDNVNNKTTAGTQLNDISLNYIDLFGRSINFLHNYIDTLSEMFKGIKIDILLIPGNHDHISNQQTAVSLKAIYSKNELINVIYSNETYYFYRYGNGALLGFTHGDERLNDVKTMSNIMMSLRPIDYAQTKTRIWNLGHFHKSGTKVLEECGIACRWYPTICPSDTWAKSKGYVNSTRAVDILTFDYELGYLRTDHISEERL